MHTPRTGTSALRADQSAVRPLPRALSLSSDLQLLPGHRASIVGDATVAMHVLAADGHAHQHDAKAAPGSRVAAGTGAIPTALSGRLVAGAHASGQRAGTATVAREAGRAANRRLTMARAAHVRSLLTRYDDGRATPGKARPTTAKRAQRRRFSTHTVRRQASGGHVPALNAGDVPRGYAAVHMAAAVPVSTPQQGSLASSRRGVSRAQPAVRGVVQGLGWARAQQARSRRRQRGGRGTS